MRIGLFAHSTNPRGGVVHALELADALTDLGHHVTVVAPDTEGTGFFRRTRARQMTIKAARCHDVPSMVARRIEEIASRFETDRSEHFDVWHAQCSITANALARLTANTRIGGFVRTVHHLDRFADQRLESWQRAGVEKAATLLTVSRSTGSELRRRYGRIAAFTGNGVDAARFTPACDQTDLTLATRLDLEASRSDRPPIFLSIGGIEARKNSMAILRAFLDVRAQHKRARLIVAGGASLLDHGGARGEFLALLRAANAQSSVTLAGIVADHEMPALYRLADALVFVSRAEGFGLCPLEAMASGTPVIVSRIAPFTEHLRPLDCLWADPDSSVDIANAMREALTLRARDRLRASGPKTAERFDWRDIARRHLALYDARAGLPAPAGRMTGRMADA